MPKLRTSEELKILFQERKEIKQRQAAKQRETYKKASQAVKKQLMDKYKAEQKKTQPEQNKPSNFNYSLSIYHTSLIERQTAEEDLYTTREQLMDWEDKHYQCIRWDVWDGLIKKLRKEFGYGRQLPHTRKQEKD